MYGQAWTPALHREHLPAAQLVGDSLDGTVARVVNQQRPRHGFYVDHVTDCAGIALLVVGVAAAGLMSLTMALAFLVA